MAECNNCIHNEVCITCITAAQNLSDKEITGIVCNYYESRADVEPVRRGKWIINSDGYYPQCSECMKEPQGRVMTDWCPNCGAKMRGEENNA